jgi:hypothetical protein
MQTHNTLRTYRLIEHILTINTDMIGEMVWQGSYQEGEETTMMAFEHDHLMSLLVEMVDVHDLTKYL